MPGSVLTSTVTFTCPHGGTGTAVPTARWKAAGSTVLTVADLVTVAGCGFNVSGAPSPCLRVEWKTSAQQVKASGNAVLLSDSVGLCVNAAGAPQGPVQVAAAQTQVRGR